MKGGIHSNSYLAQWKGEEKSIETCIQSYILTDYTLFYIRIYVFVDVGALCQLRESGATGLTITTMEVS